MRFRTPIAFEGLHATEDAIVVGRHPGIEGALRVD